MDFQADWDDIQKQSGEIRKKRILYKLDVSKPGIEISPLYSPITDKNNHNVYYTDYASAEESRKKHADYDHPEIMDLNFIWNQNARLKDCVPGGVMFDWAIASHVLEHVPDPIGWMNQILQTVNVNGYLSLALPNKTLTNDILRDETKFPQWFDAWLNQYKIPSPAQLFDFIRNTASQGVTSVGSGYDRHFQPEEAVSNSIHSWVNNEYLDAHCSVFTPSSFSSLVNEAVMLGLMNVEIEDITPGGQEFYVRIKKKGEPKVLPPVKNSPNANNDFELAHYKKAFHEAVSAQDSLKSEIIQLKGRSLLRRIFNR